MRRNVVLLSKAKAKAKVAVRKKKEAQEHSEASLIERLMAKVDIPTPERGKDGRDAPTLSEILDSVIPHLPETKIEQTVVKEVVDEDIIDRMINAKLPEIQIEDRPTVEQITVDVSDEKLEEYVTKKDFDKALVKIQRAIQESSGGRAPDVTPIANIILADSTTNVIKESDLNTSKINIIHATVSNSTVTLPKASPHYIVWVEDAVIGGGNITIQREV